MSIIGDDRRRIIKPGELDFTQRKPLPSIVAIDNDVIVDLNKSYSFFLKAIAKPIKILEKISVDEPEY